MASEAQKTQITNLSLAVALARETPITRDEVLDAFQAGGYEWTNAEIEEVTTRVNERAAQH